MKPAYIFTALVICYLAFTASVYLQPRERSLPSGHASVSAVSGLTPPAAGKLSWQRYNCQSCHQIYGLGGYLGPDLTNVVSAPGRNDAYLAGIIRSGNRVMPPFTGSDAELQSILSFLHAINATGSADPRSAAVTAWGDARPNRPSP